jgi:hypothetical protein
VREKLPGPSFFSDCWQAGTVAVIQQDKKLHLRKKAFNDTYIKTKGTLSQDIWVILQNG